MATEVTTEIPDTQQLLAWCHSANEYLAYVAAKVSKGSVTIDELHECHSRTMFVVAYANQIFAGLGAQLEAAANPSGAHRN